MMINCIDVYNPYSNTVVTDKYFSVITSAFVSLNIKVNTINSFLEKKSSHIVVTSIKDSITAKKKGYKYVFLWLQGIIPEESYLRNHSKLRKKFLSVLERRGLEASDFVFYVSNAMRNHIIRKYNYNNPAYYIMPCFNDEIYKPAFYTEGKYCNNVFLYAGSLDAWQCFEDTVCIYKLIEQKVKKCSFRILTKDQERANQILSQYDIKNFSISFVSPDKIGDEMKNAKFGFSIRKDDPVNRVATPTKLSTYISYGVLPIYSECIEGFNEIAKENKFCIKYNDESDLSHIIDCCNDEIDANEVYNKIKLTFGNYYSASFHSSQIEKIIGSIV